MTVYVLNKNQTVTGQGQTIPMQSQVVGGNVNPPTQTFEVVVNGTGLVSATVQPQGSNDGVNWVALGSAITIASGTAPQVGSAIANSTWQNFACNVTALTGTNAAVTTTMAV